MTSAASHIKKRSVTIAGHRTSISLEEIFWVSLKDIAGEKGVSLATLIEEIDEKRNSGLSSALRVYVLEHVKKSS